MRTPITPRNGELDDRIKQLFASALNIEVESPDNDLIEASLMDSLMLVELMAALEETFAVRIDVADIDVEDFRTVRRIGQLVARLEANEVPGAH
jgi:acyl carrier protein